MTKKIELEIFSKDKKIFSGSGDSITIIANNEAEITILPNHISIITYINNSPLIFKNGSSKKVFNLGKGLFKFCKNSAKLIVDTVK